MKPGRTTGFAVDGMQDCIALFVCGGRQEVVKSIYCGRSKRWSMLPR